MDEKKKIPMLALVNETKICGRCGEEKPATPEFFHLNGAQGLFHPYCKDCRHVPSPVRKRKVDTRSIESRLADTHKTCADCEEKKLKTEFSSHTANLDGLHSYCRACLSARANAYNKARLHSDWAERLLAYVRSAYANKKRVKIRTWEDSDITKDFLWELLKNQGGKCHWTGIALSLDSGKPWSISLDRLDCDSGYAKNNVVLCCKAANLARSDSSPDEMRAFIEMIRRS